jgi:hypothetical protein
MEIFGFEISRKKDELRATTVNQGQSFVAPVDDDGTPVILNRQVISVVVLMVPMSIWMVVLRMRLNLFVDTEKHL